MKTHFARTLACVATVLLVPTMAQATEENPPKLIVQITIDQFRSDYLTRFSPALDRGFAHIMENGMIDIEGEVDHAITNSAPGHASLATGAYPKTHGYSANEWWDYIDGKWQWVDGAIDPNSLVFGADDRPGYSPINMNVRSLGEWVTKADKNSKSISIGSSEVTVFYAGKTSDHAYWYDREAGRYISSTFFRQKYPAWVEQFNTEQLAAFKTETWEVSVAEKHLTLADDDDRSYESFGEYYTFPHRFADEYDADHERSRQKQLDYWFYETPMADIATFELAKIAIEAEELGQRDHTDYLSIALGATDNIGHIYGGFSLEALDIMVRVDQEIGNLIDFLDEKVGENNYVIAVSGDHGAPEPIERTLERGESAYRITNDDLDTLLDRIDQIGDDHTGTRQDLIDKIETELENADFIEDAITEAEALGQKSSDNPLMPLYAKSWVKGRIPDFPLWTTKPNRIHHPARYGIFAQFAENNYFSYGVVVHGSPYKYDRLVPIMFYGKNVPARKVNNLKTIDIAPTLAHLAGVEMPGTVDGHVVD